MRKELPALFYVSFGGPEGPDDVMPFLENVTRGRNIPRERLLEVAEHYYHYGGVSPINAENRKVIAALEKEFVARDLPVRVYFGNRNWKPYLLDAVQDMRRDGVEYALAFFTSVFSCYSGCRQYRENILAVQKEVGEDAPKIEKMRNFHNHPHFIAVVRERVLSALGAFDKTLSPQSMEIIFTAHSIPLVMAEKSAYRQQLEHACQLVMKEGREEFSQLSYRIAYQSRSGAPHMPWLEPDILDVIREIKQKGKQAVVVVPIGFVSDHMEVQYDLDEEARQLAKNLGLQFQRALSPGDHPLYISMIADLYEERALGKQERPVLGAYSAMPDSCPAQCCLS